MQNKYLLILTYLLSYCLIVLICSIFQWEKNCDFILSDCSIDTDSLNTILQTSASIITPLFAIWGYFIWRDEDVYKKSKEIMASVLNQTNEVYKTWRYSRNYIDTYSRFNSYCLKSLIPMNPEILENSELSKQELERIRNVYKLLNNLNFSLNHLHIVNKKLDLNKIFGLIDNISDELKQCMTDLFTFQSQLSSIKNNYVDLIQPEERIREICHKLDFSSSPLGRIDHYGEQIDVLFKNITKEISSISDKI